MATYAVTNTINQDYEAKYTITGAAAANSINDATAAVSGSGYESISVTLNVVKAGTTDKATVTIQGSEDGVTWHDLPDIANSPNNGTADTPTTAATHSIGLYYVIGGKGAYVAARYPLYRVTVVSNGTTDNMNVTDGVISLKKN